MTQHLWMMLAVNTFCVTAVPVCEAATWQGIRLSCVHVIELSFICARSALYGGCESKFAGAHRWSTSAHCLPPSRSTPFPPILPKMFKIIFFAWCPVYASSQRVWHVTSRLFFTHRLWYPPTISRVLQLQTPQRSRLSRSARALHFLLLLLLLLSPAG